MIPTLRTHDECELLLASKRPLLPRGMIVDPHRCDGPSLSSALRPRPQASCSNPPQTRPYACPRLHALPRHRLRPSRPPLTAVAVPPLGVHRDPRTDATPPPAPSRSPVLRFLVSACYFWVGSDTEPLTALAILSGFASPCTSADLPFAKSTCAIIRGNPKFSLLVQRSLKQVRAEAETAASCLLSPEERGRGNLACCVRAFWL